MWNLHKMLKHDFFLVFYLLINTINYYFFLEKHIDQNHKCGIVHDHKHSHENKGIYFIKKILICY